MSHKKKHKKNKYDQFELMDRCHVVLSLVDDILVDHPALTMSQGALLAKAEELLYDLYQSAGGQFWKTVGDKK